MANLKGPIDEQLYAIAQEHLAKLADYVPGPVRKKGTRPKLLKSYKADPVFSIFGLDSSEYLGATLAGGTVTSIHRKIGDIYEACVRSIFMQTLNLSATDVTYTATIRSGNEEQERSADAFLSFDKLEGPIRKRVGAYCKAEVAKLTSNPNINLIGIAMEVRHCYQTGDSKRTQADEAMARHLMLSGILPVMPLFCNQSNPGIISRYRSVWVIKEGMDAYDMIREMSEYDFFDFLKRNRRDLRAPIIELLRSLTN